MFPYESPTHLAIDDRVGPLSINRLAYPFGAFLLALMVAPGGMQGLVFIAVATALGFLLGLWSPLGYDALTALVVVIDHARLPARAVWRPAPPYDPYAVSLAAAASQTKTRRGPAEW